MLLAVFDGIQKQFRAFSRNESTKEHREGSLGRVRTGRVALHNGMGGGGACEPIDIDGIRNDDTANMRGLLGILRGDLGDCDHLVDAAVGVHIDQPERTAADPGGKVGRCDVVGGDDASALVRMVEHPGCHERAVGRLNVQNVEIVFVEHLADMPCVGRKRDAHAVSVEPDHDVA